LLILEEKAEYEEKKYKLFDVLNLSWDYIRKKKNELCQEKRETHWMINSWYQMQLSCACHFSIKKGTNARMEY
jgi:hypothetical protein